MSKNNCENETPANTQFLSDNDIRRSIECLSFFLSGLRPGTVRRHELNPTGVALMHFATLLSGKTGTAAVTGSISISRDGSSASAPEFRGIISITENSRETGDLVECSVPERFEISAKTQNEEDLKNKFLRLIEEKNHANVPLQDHVEDLLTLHSLFNKKVVNLNTVHQFIHLRALSRLRARFGAYKSLWKTNLLIMLEQWSPQSQDASFSIKMRNLRDSHPQWRALLDSRGYPKANTGDPNARHVHFSATDCQMLLRFLVFSLRRAMLQAETNELDLMISNLRVVYAIVLDPALESLFTQTSLYDSLQSKEKHPAVERLKTNDNEIMEPLEQNEDEEDGRQEIESMEEIDTSRNLAYPLQYIKALTAWCAAIDYFFRPNAQVDTGTFELLVFKRTKLVVDETPLKAHDFLRRRLETIWCDKDLEVRLDQLQKKIEERRKTRFSSYVHVEAGLMVYCHNRDKLDVLPIGVSKKCCYLCFRLRQYLQEHGRGTIWVPGTHGTIYGWSPPPFPIPTSVLRNLEDDLLTVLWRDAPHLLSQQSSPATPDKVYVGEFDLVLDET